MEGKTLDLHYESDGNNTVVNEIRELLPGEFVCYGYKKTAKYLNRRGYIRNRKKVRRLMSENNLLNYPYN